MISAMRIYMFVTQGETVHLKELHVRGGDAKHRILKLLTVVSVWSVAI